TRGRSRAQSQAALESAAGGSMIIEGRADQGMRGDPNAMGPGRVRVPGTSGIFNYWRGRRSGHDYTHAESAAFADEQRRIAAAAQQRDKIDSALRGGGNLGGAHITVDFNGVPKDVKTNAELLDEGVFKSLKLNRSTSQAGM